MTVYIAAVNMSGGTQHEHIAKVVWVMDGTYRGGISTTSEIVDFINKGNSVMVGDGSTKVQVGVVKREGRSSYIRTFADNKWTDNLLAVPRF